MIINEGADHWIKTYRDEIHFLISFNLEFTGGMPVDVEIPESPKDIPYTQSENPQRGMNNVLFAMPDTAHMTLGRGWLYDPTSYREETHTVLSSIWPEYETVGKVILEYWEGFFQPDPAMTIREAINPDIDSPNLCYTGTLPGEESWSYFWIDCDYGSYVFHCEDTESWSGFDYYEDTRMNYLRVLIETLKIDD